MKDATRNFQVVVRNFQPYSTDMAKVLMINKRKRRPWMGPRVWTRPGLWPAYLRGTAINTSNKRERPSEKARRRSRPSREEKYLRIFKVVIVLKDGMRGVRRARGSR